MRRLKNGEKIGVRWIFEINRNGKKTICGGDTKARAEFHRAKRKSLWADAKFGEIKKETYIYMDLY